MQVTSSEVENLDEDLERISPSEVSCVKPNVVSKPPVIF